MMRLTHICGEVSPLTNPSFCTLSVVQVGIIIDVLTDNNNRASAEIRTVVNKHNMKIASPGSVGFNFDRKGVIRVPVDQIKDLDEFFLEVAEVRFIQFSSSGSLTINRFPFSFCSCPETHSFRPILCPNFLVPHSIEKFCSHVYIYLVVIAGGGFLSLLFSA